MDRVHYRSLDELEAGLDFIRQSPREVGRLELIVRRPRDNERETLQEAELSIESGVVGDNWKPRGSRSTPDGSAARDRQITLINSRLIDLLAGDQGLWQLAGDQLYVDLDLSADNLPPGTRLEMGTAILEITTPPHTGCKKFSGRFGLEALTFISNPSHKDLHLRGIYARVLQPGTIHQGDAVRKLG